MLLSPGGASPGLSEELISGDFSEVLGDLLSADGKLKPLNIAALKELGLELSGDFEGLAQLDSSSQTLGLSQVLKLKSLLSSATDKQIENVELFGNPELQNILKTNLNNTDIGEEGLLNSLTNKTDLLSTKVIGANTDILQQSTLKKDVNLSQVFDETGLSKIMKHSSVVNDIDFSREFMTQVGNKETNNVKLVDQLASLDKPLNPITSINNHSVKSYTGMEQTGLNSFNRIEAPVTQSGWGEAVGNRMLMMVNSKINSANIQLNPAELGPIEIRVNVNNEHATVHFVSNNAAVRDAIEDAFPRLKEMFSQNGLSLSDANVSQHSSQQSSQQGDHLFNEQNENLTMLNNESSESAEEEARLLHHNMLDIGLVDQYV
jgi:flagellar hook-length control protein FliK